MRRGAFVLALSFLWTSLVGCQTEVDPAHVQAQVIGFGEFGLLEGRPTLISSSVEIACEQGKIFGVDYQIDVANGESGEIPVDFRWVHPELAVPSLRLWGPETPAGASRPKLERGRSSLAGRALWELQHVDELVSGRYEFQIRRLDDGSIILSQPFDVRGC